MRSLPLEKRFTGDGFGSENPVVLVQVDRNERAALYSRSREKSAGRVHGYEVFIIKTVNAGSSLPGGGVVEETYESYPGSNSFGKTAWFFGGRRALEHARNKFVELSSVGVDLADPKGPPGGVTVITWPTTEFTIKQVVADTGLDYLEARAQVIAAIAAGELEEAGKQKTGGRGKPSVLYRRKP